MLYSYMYMYQYVLVCDPNLNPQTYELTYTPIVAQERHWGGRIGWMEPPSDIMSHQMT